MKRVLVVYFSQTGQLESIARSFVRPLDDSADIHIDFEKLEPNIPYPFPWPFSLFFDQFPETVHLCSTTLKPYQFEAKEKYDLIILAYTVWFLSPSPPITTFLKSTKGKALLNGAAVITLIGCRNMWLEAQEQVKTLLKSANARHLDNVVLTDKSSTLKTLITTPRWMFTGRRNAFFGIFPKAGILSEDIDRAQRFGKALLPALLENKETKEEPLLFGLNAVRVNPKLIDSEKISRRSFMIWGKLFMALGPQGHPRRKFAAIAYGLFLICTVLIIVPVMMCLRMALSPLRKHFFDRQVHYFEQPSGSSDSRMEEYL